MRFYVPKTLESDFDAFLNTDIPGAVMDFEHLHNWYDRDAVGYKKKTIRGEIYPDSTKSRYANTDNNLNFRASRSSDIEAGDMVVDVDGIIYLLDWEVPPEPNNKMSRALRCNAIFEFKRWQEEKVNSRGIVVEEAQWKTIASPIPCNAYRYDGRPEFSAISFAPGVIPNALTMISVQLNEFTSHLKVDDQFTWANEDYIIIDVSYAGTDIYSNRGVLKLQAKKKAGGMNHE